MDMQGIEDEDGRQKYNEEPPILQLYVKHDLDTGALKGFLNNKNEFTLNQLFGDQNFDCYFDPNKTDMECYMGVMGYLDNLRKVYPHSFFFQKISSVAESVYRGSVKWSHNSDSAPDDLIKTTMLYSGYMERPVYYDSEVPGLKKIFPDTCLHGTKLKSDTSFFIFDGFRTKKYCIPRGQTTMFPQKNIALVLEATPGKYSIHLPEEKKSRGDRR
jgi:hypothetical protein